MLVNTVLVNTMSEEVTVVVGRAVRAIQLPSYYSEPLGYEPFAEDRFHNGQVRGRKPIPFTGACSRFVCTLR